MSKVYEVLSECVFMSADEFTRHSKVLGIFKNPHDAITCANACVMNPVDRFWLETDSSELIGEMCLYARRYTSYNAESAVTVMEYELQ